MLLPAAADSSRAVAEKSETTARETMPMQQAEIREILMLAVRIPVVEREGVTACYSIMSPWFMSRSLQKIFHFFFESRYVSSPKLTEILSPW